MKVKPTNSGTIVHARAHVLIGSFEPLAWAACTFLNTLKSTNGPFLLERLIGLLQFQLSIAPRLAAADDSFVRGLTALASPTALGGHASGAHRMAATFGAAFAATMWVVDRVHRR